MFDFGTRSVNKQGGSFLISLPMDWIKNIGYDLKKVSVSMDDDKNIIVAPAPGDNQETGASSSPEGYYHG